MYLVFHVQIKHFISDNCQGKISQFYFYFISAFSTNIFFLLVLVSVDSNSAALDMSEHIRIELCWFLYI